MKILDLANLEIRRMLKEGKLNLDGVGIGSFFRINNQKNILLLSEGLVAKGGITFLIKLIAVGALKREK